VPGVFAELTAVDGGDDNAGELEEFWTRDNSEKLELPAEEKESMLGVLRYTEYMPK